MSTTIFDPQVLSDEDLTHELIQAHHSMTTNQAAFVLSLAEFNRRELWRGFGATSAIAWLCRRLNIARSTAYSYFQTSLTVSRFPLICDAFLEGKLSYSQVQLLCRYLTEDNEYELLVLALSRTVRELELILAGHPDNEADKKAGKKKESWLELWIDNDGDYRIEGRLSPSQGAKLSAGIKMGELASLTDLAELPPERLDDDEELGTLLEETEAASASRFGPTTRSNVLSGFFGMVNLARTAKHSAQRAPGAQVHVVLTEDGHSFMPLNPKAPSQSLVNLVNDAQVRGYLLDSKGVMLHMGRKRRLASQSQELALLVSWLFKCATPSCPHTRFLEFHHITGWAEGGLTDVGDMIPLCSACHSMVTEGLIKIKEDPTDASRLLFFFNDGTVYASINRGLPVREEQEEDVSADEVEVAHCGDWDLDSDISFDDPDDADEPADTAEPSEPPEEPDPEESSEVSRRLDTEAPPPEKIKTAGNVTVLKYPSFEVYYPPYWPPPDPDVQPNAPPKSRRPDPETFMKLFAESPDQIKFIWG